MNKVLSDISEYVVDKIGFQYLNAATYVGMDNLLPNRGGVTISEYVPSEGQFTAFHKGDVLLGNIRPYFKKIWLAEYDGGCSPDVLCLRAKNGVSPLFLYAVLAQDAFFDYDVKGAKGSKMPRGDKDHIMLYPVPDVENADVVGFFIDSIYRKIQNNNAICSNLEALAKLLYDYWFVQFDFPDENGKPYKFSGGKMVWNEELKREIPAGWEVNKLPNVCDIQYGFPLSTELFGEDGKCVIRIRDISANTVSAKTREIVGKEYLTHAGDLLVGMDGNFQMNFWTRDNEIVNQRITRIRQTIMPLLVVKMQIEPYITAKVSNVARSTVGHLGDADFKKQPILCPDKMDYSFFEIALNAIVELRNENQQLASLRDFLLPMLMNGQITITPQKKEA